ncbi:MAG: hypothetical protein K0R65_1900 [Crocinitomicaceae bacterium]|jgi:uncharacterized protein (DUF1800 family)|nr:hypothetical protein [Crocinitomicaceae bacterium]
MIPEEYVEAPVSLSLTPYAGPWTQAHAAHLLRRTLFGPKLAQINAAVTNGMDATVAQLLVAPAFAQPLTHDTNDSIVSQGSTWIGAVCPTNPIDIDTTETSRRQSLIGWQFERLNMEGVSIYEKMCLFWQNHFAAESTFDSRATYNYLHLIRTHALGNFRQFVKDITIDPCMLIFLNGAQNNQFSPNENYARELLELYTIGKGPQIGEGDYTNYTEQDVMQGAKILTGWNVEGFLSNTETTTSSVFVPILHDTSSKTLSAHFGNAVINDAGASEYANYIDIIFQQPETAKFICRKIYRWFVNYDLTSEVETTVIADLADILTANNYEILPVIETLLKSEHFYDSSVRGAIIKNPLEYMFSMLNTTSTQPAFDLNINYRMYLSLYWASASLGMAYLQPPSVGGWPAYYQAPNYTKLWINSSYVKLRFDFASYIALWGGINVDGNRLPINHLGFLDSLSLPSDAPQVIEDMVTVFCPKGLTSTQKLLLKAVLTNGLPDFEWTLQYNEYLANPGNTTYSDPVKQRIGLTIDQIFKMPEFQTI